MGLSHWDVEIHRVAKTFIEDCSYNTAFYAENYLIYMVDYDIHRDKVEVMYTAELLTVIMQAADLLNALNWLPRRPWRKSFPVWQVRLHCTWRPWHHHPFPLWQVS